MPLIRPGGRVLDLAAGAGRHTSLLLAAGYAVTAADRDVAALQPLAGPRCTLHEVDLETGAAEAAMARLGGAYDGVVVTNYLHRPLFAPLRAALAPGGVLIYETFAIGNERFGRPHNPDFLLRPGELLEACAGLSVIAFEQGEVGAPRPGAIQRIAAINGPFGRLPRPALDNEPNRD